MQYRYIKSQPLGAEEKQRLRVAVGLELRMKGIIRQPPRSSLARQLLAMLEQIELPAKEELRGWVFSYCRPSFFAELFNAVAEDEVPHPDFNILRVAGLDKLLPREYITPDFQCVQKTLKPQNALVCFTGNGQRLNLPMQLFHCLAMDYFDQIFYLRDRGKNFYTQGMPDIFPDFDSLALAVRAEIPLDCHVAVFGCSSGGHGAALFAEAVGVDRVALFSPPLTYRGVPSLSKHSRMRAQNVKVFFAGRNALDNKLAAAWRHTAYAPTLILLDTESHGTVRYLYGGDKLRPLLNWLSGGKNVANASWDLRNESPPLQKFSSFLQTRWGKIHRL